MRAYGKAPLFVEDLTPAQVTKLTTTLRGKGDSDKQAYLRPNEDLLESAQHKSAALAKLGVTHAALADRISSVAHGDVYVSGVGVKSHVFRGVERCPFEVLGTKCPQRTSVVYDFFDAEERTVEVPGLAAHLVSAHHFLPAGVRFELDPEEMVTLLRLQPTVVAPPAAAANQWVEAPTTEPNAAPKGWLSTLFRGAAQDNAR